MYILKKHKALNQSQFFTQLETMSLFVLRFQLQITNLQDQFQFLGKIRCPRKVVPSTRRTWLPMFPISN
ncbi:hypothetical protein Pelo_19709 [Pelomyxa schiedti]|nr:hypothetical protein Pelo_19709 [Pelomyxa schiedti]